MVSVGVLAVHPLGLFYLGDKVVFKLHCANERMGSHGKEKCDRILISIPDWIITQLKLLEGDPEARIILRCPSCPSAGRFSKISFVDGKLAFQTITEELDLGKRLDYEDVSICSEAGLLEDHGKVKSGKSV